MSKVLAKDLFDFDHPAVDPASVRVRITPRWLDPIWQEPFVAIAVPWAIYLRHDIGVLDPGSLRRVLDHELVHIAQWRRLGVARFITSYVGDYLKARRDGMSHLDAYAAISLECEARQADS